MSVTIHVPRRLGGKHADQPADDGVPWHDLGRIARRRGRRKGQPVGGDHGPAWKSMLVEPAKARGIGRRTRG